MSYVAFTVYGRPMPAGSKRAFVNPKTGKAIVTDANAKAKPWKQEIAAAAAEAMSAAGLDLFTDAVILRVDFYLARPKGHYGTGRNAGAVKPSAPLWPAVAPDATKLVRGLEDALKGVVWRDDALVVDQTVRKLYGSPERAVVLVSTIGSGVHVPAGERAA